MSAEKKTNRIYSIDFLRIIASCLIVLYHYQIFGGYFKTGGLNFAGGRFDFSTMVEFFFISAGFFEVSVKKCSEMKFGDFYIPRMIRLIPQVALSVPAFELLAFFLNSLEGASAYTVDAFGSVITALCLHGIGIFENPWINGATWFVSVLLLCHLLYFFMVKLCKKTKLPPFIPFALMIVLGLVLKITKTDLPFLTVFTGRGYCMFFLGCIMSESLNEDLLKKFGKIWEPALWLLTAGALALHLSSLNIPMKGLLLYFIVYPGLFVLFYFGKLRSMLNAKILEKLGSITYDVYVWHGPILLLFGILLHFIPQIDRSSYIVAFAFVAVMFIIGSIIYRFIDKPLTAFLKKRTGI